jgi:hypothetical protein
MLSLQSQLTKNSFLGNRPLIAKFLLIRNSFAQMSTQSSNKSKIAVCQLTCGADKQENFNICKQLISQAKKEGAQVKLNQYFIA